MQKKKKNLDEILHLPQKINSKGIINLNIKFKMIKLLEVNIGENLGDLRYGNEVLEQQQKHKSMKETIIVNSSWISLA